jgi:carboxypeptidase C (cathepsin A)
MTNDTKRLWLRVAIVIVLFACGMRSFAQDTPEARRSVVSTEAVAIDVPVHTHHSITLEGRQLNYIATAGTLRVWQDKGDAEADVFYVSYRKDGGDAAKRPITFVFNGGPGSRSLPSACSRIAGAWSASMTDRSAHRTLIPSA